MSDFSKHSDEELILLLKEGSNHAFTEIYNRHWKFLYNNAYHGCRNREDSMDICQALFVWLWENRLVLHITTTLKGYLYTAVKYKVANLIRNGKIRESLFDDLAPVDTLTYKSNELEIKELQGFIAQLIDGLPQRCKEVFLLSRNEHLSHKEIAVRLGISEKTVDEHIHRALNKLRLPLDRLAFIFLLF